MKNNNQSTKVIFSIMAVVIATSLVASVVFDQAYARHHNHYKGGHHYTGSQSITQANSVTQSSSVVTSGAGSSVTNSGNNAATQTNTNNGGNAAA